MTLLIAMMMMIMMLNTIKLVKKTMKMRMRMNKNNNNDDDDNIVEETRDDTYKFNPTQGFVEVEASKTRSNVYTPGYVSPSAMSSVITAIIPAGGLNSLAITPATMTALSARSTDSPCSAITFTAKQASSGLRNGSPVNTIGSDAILDAPDVYGNNGNNNGNNGNNAGRTSSAVHRRSESPRDRDPRGSRTRHTTSYWTKTT